MAVQQSCLTRIRPNNCAFKDAFFGSNPLESNPGAVKIGHHRHFTGAVRRNNPKLFDQVRAVSRLKHYSIRTEQAHTDWTRRFIVFHTKRTNGV